MYKRSTWEIGNSPSNNPRSRHLLNNLENGVEQANSFLGNGPEVGSSWGMWEDLRFDSNGIKAAGIKDPAYTTFATELRAYWFSPTTSEDLFLNVQMPHAWDGSAIYPHMHWIATTGSSVAGHQVRWGIEYSWANIGSTISAPTTVHASTSFPNEQIEVNKHYITSFDPITPSTNQNGLSSMMMCRIFRDSTVVEDTFTHGAFLFEFDIHYRMNMVGSRQELSK
jgi:hypothetical protein